MSSSADLKNRLLDKKMMINTASDGVGGWSDNYFIPMGTHECRPNYVATVFGESPYGFGVCRRKINSDDYPPIVQPTTKKPQDQRLLGYQTYNLYSDNIVANPGISALGGQPLSLQNRRLPLQAHLQGADYYRDAVKYRATGIENMNKHIGDFGYKENKYFYSSPPPIYDETFAVQPYELWKNQQIRMGNLSIQEVEHMEKYHKFKNINPVF